MSNDVAMLTPTQDLVMEVLAARYRLGEECWTFPANRRPAVQYLAEKGLVTWKEGIVERTVLVWLTEAGRARYVTEGYTPPIFARLVTTLPDDALLAELVKRGRLKVTISDPAA